MIPEFLVANFSVHHIFSALITVIHTKYECIHQCITFLFVAVKIQTCMTRMSYIFKQKSNFANVLFVSHILFYVFAFSFKIMCIIEILNSGMILFIKLSLDFFKKTNQIAIKGKLQYSPHFLPQWHYVKSGTDIAIFFKLQ